MDRPRPRWRSVLALICASLAAGVPTAAAEEPVGDIEQLPLIYVASLDSDALTIFDRLADGALAQNDDVASATSTLTVVKQVVNDDGGVKAPENFTLHVKQNGTDVADSPQAGSSSGTAYTLSPGTYDVSEVAVASYAASFTGDCNASGQVTLADGDDKTCTVVNNDRADPGLVVRSYSRDRAGGGDYVLAEHFLSDTRRYIEDPANFGPSGVVGRTLQVGPGIDTASAATLAGVDIFFTGWIPTDSYTDEEKQALREFVLGGGTLIATTDDTGHTMVDLFGLTQQDASGNPTPNKISDPAHPIGDGPFGSVTDYNQYALTGYYSELGPDAAPVGGQVDESGDPIDGHTTLAAIERGRLGPGSGAVVLVADIDVFSDADNPGGGSVFNETLIKNIFAYAADRPATLRVVKQVVNDDGGTRAPDDFSLHVKQGGADVAGSPQAGTTAGTTYTLPPGSYDVTEDAVSGYAGTFSGGCNATGQVTLAPGDQKTCTVTNDDVAPTLRVVKHVVNDDGGTAAAGAWSMHIKTGTPPTDVTGSPFPGTEAGTTTTVDAGSYTVSESGGPSGYAASFSEDCDASGELVLAPGDQKTCTVTNDDVAPEGLVLESYAAGRTDGEWGLTESLLTETRAYVEDPANFGPGGTVPRSFAVGPGIDVASAESLAGVDVFFTGWITTTSYTAEERAALREFVLAGGTLIATTDDTGHTMVDLFGLTQADADGNPTPNKISDPAHGIADGPFGSVTDYNQYQATGYYPELGPDAVPVGGQVDGSGDLVDGHTTLAVIERDKLAPGAGAVIFVADIDVFSNEGQGGAAVNATLIKNIFAYAAVGEASPALSIDDVTADEGNAGTTDFTFTVRLSTPSASPVEVHYATADDTATSPSDYSGESGDLTFAPGETSKQVAVQVNGDTEVEPDERFRVDLSAAVGARIADAQGTGEITNDDALAAPTLTVVKQVVNDDGGTHDAADFSLHVKEGDVDVAGSPQPGDEEGTTYTLEADTPYVVSEDPVTGYEATFTGDCDADGSITLAAGDTKTCTVTNDDVAPTLTVIKHVINDDGGAAVAGDWSMHIETGLPLADVPGSPFPGSETGTTTTVDAGSYVVSESDGPKGYAAAISGDCAADGSITLAPGDEKSCTITNNDEPAPATATLRIVKLVVNDDGGTAAAGDWSMHVRTGAPPAEVAGSPFPGSEAGTSMTLQAGSYDISESDGPSGYAASFSDDCNDSGQVTLRPGDDKTCTVTNDDVAATLTVVKHVVNDDGGAAVAGDWNMHVQTGAPLTDVAGSPFPGSEAGTATSVDVGSYVVSETDGPAGYTAAISGDCAADGTITLALGDDKTCTITNDDDEPPAAATLRVVKHVVNDDGGTATAGAWNMHIRAGSPLTDVTGSPFPGSEAGTSRTLDAGSYTVGESGGLGGYTASISGDCAADGTVTLAPGDSKTCTITNDDAAQPPPPPSSADLELSKSASDSTPGLGDDFTYSLTVFNRGPGTAVAVVVTDDLPDGLRLRSVPAGCSGDLVCALGDLPAGASRTVTLNVEARLGCDFVGTSGDDGDGAIGSTGNGDVICGGGGKDRFGGAGGRDRLYGFAPPGMVPKEVPNTAAVTSATADPDPGDNSANLAVRVVGGRDRGDTISGAGGADKLYGAAGNDRLFGGDGADRLEGGEGKDLLEGGAEGDRLLAGDGAKDRIRCGPGRDRVTADRKDVVTDDCERVVRR